MTNYKGGAIADLKVCSTQGQVKKKSRRRAGGL